MNEDDKRPLPARFAQPNNGTKDTLAADRAARNPDLDPQLIWRGKYAPATPPVTGAPSTKATGAADAENAAGAPAAAKGNIPSDPAADDSLIVPAAPLYIQERIHPKALIDDLRRQTVQSRAANPEAGDVPDIFADFNGLPDGAERTEFYQHEANWSNRFILGDSLQAMASLAEREGLRGKVQCIYIDPPYGIKFNSNFQWLTTRRDVKDGKTEHITREPEQVKAFRDTWRDGIHSYLSYLRDRLIVCRELLTESGSCFVQIGDENVHRVRVLMDEVFGDKNCITQIAYKTTTGRAGNFLSQASNYLLWYAKSREHCKYRELYEDKSGAASTSQNYKFLMREDGSVCKANDIEAGGGGGRLFSYDNLRSQSGGAKGQFSVSLNGLDFAFSHGSWKTSEAGMSRLIKAGRICLRGNAQSISYVRFFDDFPLLRFSNVWGDTGASFGDKSYIVQTADKVIQRCLLMTTDPGDLVLDPTCGSGTTAYVAEQWGRRWITIDTSRVALVLARARLMGARYPFYLLADSKAGQDKLAEITDKAPASTPTGGDICQGFVCQRVPHITLKAIANNAEIDSLWAEHQPAVESALKALNEALKGHKTPFTVQAGGRKGQAVDFTATDKTDLPSGESVPAGELLEWEVPRDPPDDWPAAAKAALAEFWQARIARQHAIDASIARNAEYETLHDKPYEDRHTVRVAGPFTMESLSPHRTPAIDENGELMELPASTDAGGAGDFVRVILDNLKIAGIQQVQRSGRIAFDSLTDWPGELVAAEGVYTEPGAVGADSSQKRAAIFIGPEFGTVGRQDLAAAAREAAESGFDVLIACAFNYDAGAADLNKLGRLPILQARMNADLHMAGDLAKTDKANLFVIFGEPDIEIEHLPENKLRVHLRGIDLFDPQTGQVRSGDTGDIACWFIDTGYNHEAFFVRHAYFLGADSPYKALKTTLKADIDPEAWASLHSATSRPFDRPDSGCIAVKAINHLGDEVMRVFGV
ncbi:MAG: site-specific DNA-methyltransferase [Cellvibrionales bacterium]|nr:site-specific DNA-methyltransferase [Cellvibrionales bacterium]